MRDPFRAKLKWAGAPSRQKPRAKLKLKGGRPRRHRPPEAIIKTVRRNIPSALNNPATLALVRMLAHGDDLIIAKEAYEFLAARDGRRVKRDDRIETIADWLKMDAGRLKNWLNRAKRTR
jgi:hypothetical protein